MGKVIFCFGSNEAGIHGAGAAKIAYKEYGARWGKCYGHYGDSFAIPTKNENIETLPLVMVRRYIDGFIAYAYGHRKLKFKVTQIGCGLAGFRNTEIAPLFRDAPTNCEFDGAWRLWLGEGRAYWGTYP